MSMNGTDTLATADVVVVGAGLAGLTTAFELRRRGFDVVVIEQRFPAFGASGRNPGAIWLQTRRAGTELSLARAGKNKFVEYIEELGDVFDYTSDGGLFFAETDAQAHALADYVTDRQAAGLDVEWLTHEQALKHSPLLPRTAIGAVFCADDAQVDTQQFIAALSAAVVRKGVRLIENTAVLSTIRHGDAVAGVRTVRGEVHAPGLVWATGAWSTTLRAEGLAVPLTTARMGQVVTQPVEQATSALLHGPRGVAFCGALTDLSSFDPAAFATPQAQRPGGGGADEHYDDVIAQNRSGALYIGSSIDSVGALNPHISISSTEAMISTTRERFPEHANIGVTGLWAGLMTETHDHLPIVDKMDGAFVNSGHSWGVASAPVCGQVMAEIIAGESSEFATALRADRPALRHLAP